MVNIGGNKNCDELASADPPRRDVVVDSGSKCCEPRPFEDVKVRSPVASSASATAGGTATTTTLDVLDLMMVTAADSSSSKRYPTLTSGELEKLGKAVRDPEFRAMLVDYAKEVSDPENVALREREMAEMMGFRCMFLRPTPGYVIKALRLGRPPSSSSSSSSEPWVSKVFVNVCSDPNVGRPEKSYGSDGRRQKMKVPYVQAKVRREADRKGAPCDTYDVVFHPDAVAESAKDRRVRDVLNNTALDAVEKSSSGLGLLDRKNLRFPKLKFKGRFRPTVIRLGELPETPKKPGLRDEFDGLEASGPGEAALMSSPSSSPLPDYSIKYKSIKWADAGTNDLCYQEGHVGSAAEKVVLVVEVRLPGLTSSRGIDLDVTERQLTLKGYGGHGSADRGRLPDLVIDLPVAVADKLGTAKFDKSAGVLEVSLPVVPGPAAPKYDKVSVERLISTDSGLELDFDDDIDDEVTGDNGAKVAAADQEKSAASSTTLEAASKQKLILPPFTCNIYEEVMVFKLDVRNVRSDSVKKTIVSMDGGRQKGFSLTFSNVGSGMVDFHYGFNVVFNLVVAGRLAGPAGVDFADRDDTAAGSNSDDEEEDDFFPDDVQVEVWDNNMIVQLSLPKVDCRVYKVGPSLNDLTDHPLPPLKAFRQKRDQLQKKARTNVDLINSKASFKHAPSSTPSINIAKEEYGDTDCKERHSSGDSLLSSSPPSNSRLTEKRSAAGTDLLRPKTSNDRPDEIIIAAFEDSLLPTADASIKDLSGCSKPAKGILKHCNIRRCFSESYAEAMKKYSVCMGGDGGVRKIEEDEAEVTKGLDHRESDSSTRSEDISCGSSSGDEDASAAAAAGVQSSGGLRKKSVRFNEVVQRQVFRANSSILGQRLKNIRRNEQKQKSRLQRKNLMFNNKERRASESDAEALLADGFKLSSSFEQETLSRRCPDRFARRAGSSCATKTDDADEGAAASPAPPGAATEGSSSLSDGEYDGVSLSAPLLLSMVGGGIVRGDKSGARVIHQAFLDDDSGVASSFEDVSSSSLVFKDGKQEEVKGGDGGDVDDSSSVLHTDDGTCESGGCSSEAKSKKNKRMRKKKIQQQVPELSQPKMSPSSVGHVFAGRGDGVRCGGGGPLSKDFVRESNSDLIFHLDF